MKKRRKWMKGRIRKKKKKEEWKSLAVGRKVGLWIVTGKCLCSRAGYGHMGMWKTCSKKMGFFHVLKTSQTHTSPQHTEKHIDRHGNMKTLAGAPRHACCRKGLSSTYIPTCGLR